MAENTFTHDSKEADTLRETVREGYASIARQTTQQMAERSSCCAPSSGSGCCSTAPAKQTASCCGTGKGADLAAVLGYDANELSALPEGANMGLSCGNPTAIASLKPGEVVLDLGSGGGFDVFIAGQKIGPTGRVIGVDMTPEMMALARRNTATYRKSSGLDNVEFRLGEIEHLPVADNSVDVIISNCVINLSPDKAQVWREMARVLKPGGRVAVSDIALLKPLPAAVVDMVASLVGCVAGAVLTEETEGMARAAGFVDVELTPHPDYIKAMTSWEDPLYQQIVAELPTGSKTSDYVTSLYVAAKKPVV